MNGDLQLVGAVYTSHFDPCEADIPVVHTQYLIEGIMYDSFTYPDSTVRNVDSLSSGMREAEYMVSYIIAERGLRIV